MPAASVAPLAAAPAPSAALPGTPAEDVPGSRALPGPMVWRMVAVALLCLVLAAGLVGGLLARASVQAASQRLAQQQSDEVELYARLLSSKIEQHQKLLRSVADGIAPGMLELTASLEWQLQQGASAAPFFDALMVVGGDANVRALQRQGRFLRGAALELPVRSALERTLAEGKPQTAELVAGGADDARMLLTMPLHRDDGTLVGAVAGTLRLQALLAPSLSLPQRPDTRLLVFGRDGTILAHSNPVRVMGRVQDEPGLADALTQDDTPASTGLAAGAATTRHTSGAMVSLAGMPLVQWTVARVSDTQAMLSAVQGALRSAWLWAGAGLALLAGLLALALLALAQPLARLRQQAQQMLVPHPQAPPHWPRAGGEVAALVQAFEGLQARQADQRQQWLAQQAQWRTLLQHAPMGLALTHGGTLVAVGEQLCGALGYQVQELQGQAVHRLGGLGMQPGPGAPVWGPDAVEALLPLRRKDGSEVWMQARGRPVLEGGAQGSMLWFLEDATVARHAQQDSAWAATHDALTGLDNRQGLELRLQALLARPLTAPGQALRPAGVPLPLAVLLFLDLDYFTAINDTVGRAGADEVLRHVGRWLQGRVGGAGWLARLGGDEFAVLLPGVSEAHARSLAERLCAALPQEALVVQGHSVALGVSMGMAVLEPGLADVPALLHAADMACYDAKRAGRGTVRLRPVRSLALPA